MATSGLATIEAYSNNVTVTHTLGSVPEVVDINFTTQLGQRSYTVTNKTATEFTVTISSVDVIDHVFIWACDSVTLSEATLEDIIFGTLTGVKDRVGIAAGDTSQDSKLAYALFYADGIIRGQFRVYGLTVPATHSEVVDDDVVEAANDYAACYMTRSSSPEQAEVFRGMGDDLMSRYVRSGGGGAASTVKSGGQVKP